MAHGCQGPNAGKCGHFNLEYADGARRKFEDLRKTALCKGCRNGGVPMI